MALVTAEVRLTDSPRLRQQETLDAVAIALEERFPISTPLNDVTFNVPGIWALAFYLRSNSSAASC